MKELDIWEIILHSGPIVKGVLIILVIFSVMSWAIVLLKRKQLKSINKTNEQFMKLYQNSENLIDLRRKIDELPFSTYSVIFQNGYDELAKLKQNFDGDKSKEELRNYVKNFGLSTIERGLQKGVSESNNVLNEKLSILASIGSVAPFVGLFGTVWGIINSFTGLASGGGTIEAVAPGIAEALVATAVGLFAAIPAVWAFNYFSNSKSLLNSNLESFGQDFLNVIERSLTR